MNTFNCLYKRAYTTSIEFNTIIDQTFSGNEQRRDQWTNPRHSWSLDFEKNNINMQAVMAFFTQQKGKKLSFNWTWLAAHPVTGENMGGDGNTYLVRFDIDKLDFKILQMGYGTFTIPLVQVFN